MDRDVLPSVRPAEKAARNPFPPTNSAREKDKTEQK